MVNNQNQQNRSNRPAPEGNRENPEGENNRGEILNSGHNIDSRQIKNLIKSSLEPLPTDPIPKRIVIDNIEITRDQRRTISINCAVFYETRH